MIKNKITKVQKRDGTIVDFNQTKISDAIFKALTATGESDGKRAKKLSDRVVRILNRRFKPGEIPQIEQIQDIVEEVLILEGLVETAKAYILYREQRRRIREAVKFAEEAVDRIDTYLEKTDWEVQENANMAFSLQGLNRFGVSYIIKRYWLNKIYPKEIREANEDCDIHIHNLDTLGPYTFFGREVIIVKLKGEIKLFSLKNLYEELSEPELLLNEKDQAYAKYPTDLLILDKNGWTRVFRIIRKKKEREMRFIKSEQGRSLIVTDNHPFIIKKANKEIEIEAGKVKEKKDLVLSVHLPTLLNSENLFSKKYIYLAEELIKKGHSAFFLEGFEWQDFIKNWGGSLRTKGTLSVTNWANSLDNELELSEDLGYLVGIFIAEGNYDNWRIVISASEDEIINRVRRISAKLGLRAYLKEKKNSGKAKEIVIGCSTLSLVFKKIFQLKKGSKNKILPPDILTYNLDFVRGVIAGIIDGDGTRGTKNKDDRYTQLLIRVASRTLLEQMAILFQFFGIVGRDRVSTKDIGKKNVFQGKEIVQNYPLYGLAFSKKENVDFPSFKYQKAKSTRRHWRAEKYGWNKILNNELTTITDDLIYDITTESNTFLCNSLLVHNCAGWDLYDFLVKGFGGVAGKMESKPPKHFEAALGQVVNFIFTVSGEVAGAVAFSNFDTLLAPFIRYDRLDYTRVKQALQEFLFNMATPTRVGFQCPFSNITLDLKPSPVFAKMPVIIGGKPQKETYGEFEEEMKIFNKALYEAMLEGDKNGRTFSFPIPTINITKDFPWDEPAFDGIWEASAKYGINYFANYIQSTIKPEDVTAMCFPGETKVIYKKGKHSQYQRTTIRNLVKSWNPKKEFSLLINGKWVEITDAFQLKNHSGKIIKVTLKNGEIIKMTPEHPAMIVEDRRLKQILAKDLKKGDIIPIAKNGYEGKLGDFDLGKWLGLYIAEGGITKENTVYFSFNKKEKEFQEFVRKIAQERFAFSVSITKDSRWDTVQVWVKSRAAVEWVRKFCSGKSALKKRLLSPLYGMSKDFRLGTLVGIFQGDGYERDVEFNTTNRKLRDDIADLARSVGINYTKRINQNNTKGEQRFTSYVLRLCRDSLENLSPYFKNIKASTSSIYEDFGDFYGVKIKSIEIQNYHAPVYDFQVNSKEHLFQLANGVITHNCCRLLIDKRQLYNRGGGGLFGSGANTGSIGVVSINMPRIGYLSKTKKEFFERLGRMMDLAKESLEIKRKTIESFIEKSLYPYSKFYLSGVKKMRGQYYANHFSTIGPNGMNEALLNFMGENIASKRGRKFALEVLDFMRKRLVEYQKETGNIYNLEAVPGESTAYRFALKDKEKYPDIITAGTKENPFYTNSTHLPVNYTDDIFETLKLQDELQTKYTGGTVLHLFLGERISDIRLAKKLVKKIFENFHLPYITLTPTFSICPKHGYLAGEHFECPKCTIKQPCEVYSRIVGYLRPVQQWNLGKREEFRWRREYRTYRGEKIVTLPREKIPAKINKMY